MPLILMLAGLYTILPRSIIFSRQLLCHVSVVSSLPHLRMLSAPFLVFAIGFCYQPQVGLSIPIELPGVVLVGQDEYSSSLFLALVMA